MDNPLDVDVMTKREYFAGLAMRALLSTPTISREESIEWVAIFAVKYADTLIKALDETKVNSKG